MDGRVDVMPPNKFHCNRTQQQETYGKGIFLKMKVSSVKFN
jgi:hypothetical protein